MKDLELVEELLRNPDLKMKTRDFLVDVKEKQRRFGALTEGQQKIIGNIATEYGLASRSGNLRPLSTVAESLNIQPHPTSVLSDDERKEIFNFMRQTAEGKHSKEDVNKYCKLISDVLQSRGVKVEKWQ